MDYFLLISKTFKIMKKSLKILIILAVVLLLPGCGTIIGGSKYWAHVKVADSPSSKIYFKNEYQGTGSATIKVKRSEANKLAFDVKHENGETQTYKFTKKGFRGWAMVGSLLTFTSGSMIPIPYGLFLDISTGAYDKPSTKEKGVSKIDYKNFKYNLSVASPESVAR